MQPLMIAALLQLFFMAFVVSNTDRKLTAGLYLPIGIAMMGITFAAMTLATPD
ncbi:MAG: hypothetical protein ACM3S1_16765 [Hyphomicrobiales bacterium]